MAYDYLVDNVIVMLQAFFIGCFMEGGGGGGALLSHLGFFCMGNFVASAWENLG